MENFNKINGAGSSKNTTGYSNRNNYKNWFSRKPGTGDINSGLSFKCIQIFNLLHNIKLY